MKEIDLFLLIPASACVKAKLKKRNLMSSDDSKSFTGRVLSPTRIVPQSLVTGTDSPRSGTSLSLNRSSSNSQGRPLPSLPSLTPFPPSRGGNGELLVSPRGDEFPSLSLKKNLSLRMPSSVSRDSVLGGGSKSQAQNPRAGFSKLESGPTPI